MTTLTVIGYVLCSVLVMLLIVVGSIALTIHNYVWSKASKND